MRNKRSDITSCPNRGGDPEYILHLVGKVITLGVEPVRIVEGLPENFSECGTENHKHALFLQVIGGVPRDYGTLARIRVLFWYACTAFSDRRRSNAPTGWRKRSVDGVRGF